MKHALHSHQHHDLYEKYNDQDSEISRSLGECGLRRLDVEWCVLSKRAVPR